jgi:glutamyl endopeptidase
MSANLKEGKTYGYQTQPSAPAESVADTGLEQQKQKLMTDIETFLNMLCAPNGPGMAPATQPATPPATTPSGGAPSAGGYGSGTPASGAPAGGSTPSGGPATGAPATGTPATGYGTGAPATGTPATGTGTTKTTTSGEAPSTEAVRREAAAKEAFVIREAYARDRAKESARAKQGGRESARATSSAIATRESAAAVSPHTPDSNRAPITENKEFGHAFGSLGRGLGATLERTSVATSERPETAPRPGQVSGRPIDAYWASYGSAVERAIERSKATDQMRLESIIGSDDRVKVNNTQVYPWRCVCSLLITAQSGAQYIGTGWLVAPRLVLTAGHCVYMSDEGGWASQIEVMPGRNGADKPYGSAVSNQLRSVTGWTQDGNSDCDYGAILLPADKRFGEQLGWFGYAVRDDDYLKQITLNLSGYPGDGGRTNEDGTQWFMARGVKDVMDKQISYEIDTYGGQSGAPVWEMNANGSRYGVAIHTHGGTVTNGATRIVGEVFDNIVRWAGEAP